MDLGLLCTKGIKRSVYFGAEMIRQPCTKKGSSKILVVSGASIEVRQVNPQLAIAEHQLELLFQLPANTLGKAKDLVPATQVENPDGVPGSSSLALVPGFGRDPDPSYYKHLEE